MEYAGESPGNGPRTRTAWAGGSDGVLFHDAGNDGQITEGREVVVSEWDPTAKDDGMALRVWGEGDQRLRVMIHLALRNGRKTGQAMIAGRATPFVAAPC